MKQKRFYRKLIWLGLGFVLITVFVVFYFGKGRETISNETLNWKTYTNTAFHYSLKHPPDWTISAKGGADPTIFFAPYLDSPCKKGEVCSQIFLGTAKYDEDHKFEPDFITDLPGDKVTNRTMFKVGGEDAAGFESFQADFAYGGRLQYVVVFNHNKTKYVFTYAEFKDENNIIKHVNSSRVWQNKKIFDRILSTIKFTDSKADSISTSPKETNNKLTLTFDKERLTLELFSKRTWSIRKDGEFKYTIDPDSYIRETYVEYYPSNEIFLSKSLYERDSDGNDSGTGCFEDKTNQQIHDYSFSKIICYYNTIGQTKSGKYDAKISQVTGEYCFIDLQSVIGDKGIIFFTASAAQGVNTCDFISNNFEQMRVLNNL